MKLFVFCALRFTLGCGGRYRYEYGTLTPHLFKLKVGDTISMRGPYGGIKYTANQVRKQ